MARRPGVKQRGETVEGAETKTEEMPIFLIIGSNVWVERFDILQRAQNNNNNNEDTDDGDHLQAILISSTSDNLN